MKLFKHMSSLTITLRYFQDTLSRPDVDNSSTLEFFSQKRGPYQYRPRQDFVQNVRIDMLILH